MSPLRAFLLLLLLTSGVAAACGTSARGGGTGGGSGASGAGAGGSGQCAMVGESCTVYADLDGGIDIEPKCCGTARCMAIPCCYSACESMCQPPEGTCCNSGSQCGDDSQCCSGTCLHPDAESPGFGPGGNCM